MTYKETLFFIAKCLVINKDNHNKILIENHLKSGNIDWEAVVKVSTSHYVYPALYCNLKKANFLNYLPKDLIEHMIYITALNRERNLQIIAQAKEINEILLKSKITPIFLKGTGNLLEGLYEDIAERMIGDIDLIIDKNNLHKSDETLKKSGYTSTYIMFDDYRHLPRLTKKNKVAAIELHKDFLDKPFRQNFNYKHIHKFVKKIDTDFSVLSEIDSTTLNILSNQINDGADKTGQISLRNYYDYFLKTQKTSVVQLTEKFKIYNKIITSYDYVYLYVFNLPCKSNNKNTKSSKKYRKKVLNKIENKKRFKLINKFKTFKVYASLVCPIILKAFYNRSNFNFVLSRITSRDWYQRKFFNSHK